MANPTQILPDYLSFDFVPAAMAVVPRGVRISGNNSDNVLTGTALSEIITGAGGNDSISGLAGDDTLYGGAGNDSVYGGEGNDVLTGGAGADQLYGGASNDVFYGGAGADQIFGGAGIDTVSYSGNKLGVRVDLRGAPAAGGPQPEDVITDVENAVGGLGRDTITGNDVDNGINGAKGSDLLFGGGGNDTVLGGSGNDSMFGGTGLDTLVGGKGNDVINGGAGADILTGGAGTDQFIFGTLSADGTNDKITDFQVGLDKFVIADQPGGPGGTAAVAFSTLANGHTLVTVGAAANPFYQIEVTTLGGTFSQSDILFTFLG